MITEAQDRSLFEKHYVTDGIVGRIEAELMADDNALPGSKLLDLATLLKEAISIEHDLTDRLSQHPKDKSLLKQHKEYQQLVGRLTTELESALASYLSRIKAAAGPVD